jgi:hypothetical protein
MKENEYFIVCDVLPDSRSQVFVFRNGVLERINEDQERGIKLHKEFERSLEEMELRQKEYINFQEVKSN